MTDTSRATNNTSGPRIGLVLEGGGAKGAYQFGALRAFAKRGVKFTTVAGTSVGALNAAIWSTNKLDEGRKLWATITPADLYPFFRPRWLYALLFGLLLPFNMVMAYFVYALPPEEDRLTERVLLGIAASVAAVVVALNSSTTPSERDYAATA